VVLAANWLTYDWRDVTVTIQALKALGIRRIVVVGPTPQWVGSLSQQLYYFVRRHPFEPIPIRMKTGLKAEPERIDKLMAKFCNDLKVEYISPCAILENGDGVIIRFGDSADSLIALDYGHLTVAGSEYLVSHFPKIETP